MSESSEKTISEYEKDAFEEEPIEEYVEEANEELSYESDGVSEISDEHDIKDIVEELKGSMDDLTASTADIDISSNTPSDFNSEDHAFHLDFIPDSASKLPQMGKKGKAGSRNNFSFSNDRMREIERHNRILLAKILSKGQSCVSTTSGQRFKPKNAPLPPPRISSAAINRRKQQRQIDMDNQILKRKIEQIASRRPKKQFG